jgi:hypothetical protein
MHLVKKIVFKKLIREVLNKKKILNIYSIILTTVQIGKYKYSEVNSIAVPIMQSIKELQKVYNIISNV